MSASFELVLALEAAAAGEWIAAPALSAKSGGAARAAAKRGRRAGRPAPPQTPTQPDIGAAVADALRRMPDIAEIEPVQACTVLGVVDPDGAWRALLTIAGDGAQRVSAARIHALIPGIRRCETICDERCESAGAAAPTEEALRALFEKKAGCKVEKATCSLARSARRGAWRWSGVDGAIVDIELHDVRGVSPDEAAGTTTGHPEHSEPASVERSNEARGQPCESNAPPVAFCELRLVSRIASAQATDRDAASASTAATEQARADPGAPTAAAASPASSVVALEALFAAASVLTDVLPVTPTLADGYARAHTRPRPGAAVRAARIDLSRVRRPHDALVEACASIALQWFGNEAGAREGAGPEFVHQMRVALRRLKTLLKTFPRWIDDAWARTIAPDLDWLGTLLGRARDLDVFVDTTLPAFVEADDDTASWPSLRARAAARRDEAHAQVQAALRTRRYALLSLAWLRWLAMQRVSPGPLSMTNKPLADYASKRVRKHYARLIAKPKLTSLSSAERHRRRIEAKRLRYTLEFFESLASRKTRRTVAKQLGRIQSVLGDGSDAATALRFLEALDVPPYEHGFARGWCEAVNRWSAIEGERLLSSLDKPKIVREP